MAAAYYHRYNMGDRAWALPGPTSPAGGAVGRGRRGQQEVRRRGALGPEDGSPWRDLPSDYGGWKNTHRRLRGWRDRRVWEWLPGELAGEPDSGWLMACAAHAEARHDGTGATGGSGGGGVGRTKGGPTRRYTWRGCA